MTQPMNTAAGEAAATTPSVRTCGEMPPAVLERLLEPFGLTVEWCRGGEEIPGSYWGAPEAGRIGPVLHLRPDTPVHSALHEASHFICMDEARRRRSDIDAGGSALEECAVCYLQILLGETLPGIDRAWMFADMDRWGYSFRLRSTRAWFESDAGDAREFLERRGLLDTTGRVWPP